MSVSHADIQNVLNNGQNDNGQSPLDNPVQDSSSEAPIRDWRSQLSAAATALGIQPADANQPPGMAQPNLNQPVGVSQSPLVANAMKTAGEAAKVNPNPTAPGAWARNLLGGVVSSLGDAAAVGTVPPGGGWLGGVERTMQARSQRLAKQKQTQFDNNLKMSAEQREEKNAQVSRAFTAAQTVHLQKQTSLVDLQTTEAAQDIKDKTVANGKLATDAYRKNHTVKDGVSEDDLRKMISDYDQSPEKGPDGKTLLQFYDKYTVNQTGYEKKTGPDGKEYDSPTYSIVTKSANPVDIDQRTHDLIKKSIGKDVPVGTPLPGDLFDSLMTQSIQVAQAKDILNQFNEKEINYENDVNLNNAMKTAGHFLAQNVSDPFQGLESGLRNADLHISAAKQAIQAAQKKNDPEALQKAQDGLTQAQKEKSDLETVINSPKLEAARFKHADIIEKAREKAQAKAEELGSINGARIAEGYDFPSDLSKRSKDLEARKDAADAYSMQKYGHPVNWGQLEADHRYAQDKNTQNVLGLVSSIAEPGGSLDIALKAADKLPNVTDSQTLNKIFSAVGGEFNNQAVTDFHTAMYGLADEYAKVMGGGSATVPGFDHAMNLLREGYAKGNILSAAQVLQQDMAARKRGIIGNNIFLIRKYADNPEERATAVLQGKDPWAAEKAAGAYAPSSTSSNLGSGQQNQNQPPQKDQIKQFEVKPGVIGTYKFDGTQWILQPQQVHK